MRQNKPVLNSVRICACLFVVLVHAASIFSVWGQEIPVFLTPVRMLADTGDVIFMSVSAYLLFIKEFTWADNVRKKVRTILVPLIFWNLFWMIVETTAHMVMPGMFDNAFAGGWQILAGFTGIPFYLDPYYVPFWFLCDLFALNLMAPLFRIASEKAWPIVLIAAAVLWLSPLHYRIRIPFAFFALGCVLAEQEALREGLKKLPVTAVTAAGIGMGVLCMFVHSEILYRCGIVIMMAAVFRVCLLIEQKSTQDRFRAWMPYTMIVYALHGKVLMLLQRVYAALIPYSVLSGILGYFLTAAAAALISVVCGMLLRKLLPRVFALSTGGRVQY